MPSSANSVVIPMVVATGGVLLGGAVGGPKSKRSNLGVVAGAFIATFLLLLMNQSVPRIAHGIALLAAVSSALIYGPSLAKAANSIA